MSAHFVFLTDTHYYPDAPKDFSAPKMLTRGRKIHEAIPSAVNACSPEFIIHGGDLLCGGGSFEIPRETFHQSIQQVSQEFTRFEAPIYYVPGNHDCDAQSGSFGAMASEFPIPDTLTVTRVAPRLSLALANIYHDVNPLQNNVGTWTDELDQELRQASDAAHKDGSALMLVLHTWVLPTYDVGKGLVGNSPRLLNTLFECPSVIAVFTGHRHRNRIRVVRDLLFIDTSCMIGFPFGFREIHLRNDGAFDFNFHSLDLPDLIQASYDRSTPDENNVWHGEINDRITEIHSPRLKDIWQ